MLDVLLWYLWTQAFAFGGWLIASQWLRNLPDRGYGVGKALGVMLGGFAYWLAVTLGFSMNNAGAALLALAVVWGAGLCLRYAIRNTRHENGDEVSRSTHRVSRTESPFGIPYSVVIVTEILFALGFVIWAVVRSYSPDIMSAGGEKFMESMMINAILRSPTFPPNDAWLSGFSISYYYFGYIIFAMLIRLSGVAPSVGFNLGAAMIFALTVTSAFSVGYNLWNFRFSIFDFRLEDSDPKSKIQNPKSAFVAGLLTALMLALMGNLGGLMGALKCGNVLPQSFWAWLDVRDTATQVYACNGLAPSEFYGWWWDWSRVIKDMSPSGQYIETITEIPIFSFVLGDNHPHVMALPFVLIALTLALHAFQNGMRDARYATRDTPVSYRVSRIAHSVVLPAIVFGGLSFMNTWDFPIYGALFIGAALLGCWLRRERLWPTLLSGLGVMALGYLIYLPWSVTFSSQARGIGVNLFNGTRFAQFFLIYAPFLIAAAGYVWLIARDVRAPARSVLRRALGLTALVVLAGVAAVLLFGALSPQSRALAQELNTTGAAMGVTREQVSQRLLERVTDPWTVLALGSLAATCAVLILSLRPIEPVTHQPDEVITPSSAHPLTLTPLHPFILLLFGAGALLTLAVEFVYLQDLFGTRMNTVFKFYYQAWTLWSVAGAFAVMSLIAARNTAARVIGVVALIFVAFGLLYPAMAIPARSGNFTGQPTLDGAAYLQRIHPDDAKMIDWLNANLAGDAHIVEAPPANAFGAYAYEGRISTFTGLPTILGWGGHQHQWRGTTDEQARRFPLIEQIYNSTDPVEARSLLNQFGVRFVIVGETEGARFSAEGLAKFESLCIVAFQSGNSVIYRCGS